MIVFITFFPSLSYAVYAFKTIHMRVSVLSCKQKEDIAENVTFKNTAIQNCSSNFLLLLNTRSIKINTSTLDRETEIRLSGPQGKLCEDRYVLSFKVSLVWLGNVLSAIIYR